ncbi:MATE family efflux transporter [Paracoccus sphaerophysae]|uniref:Multidrug-efflux transporter n=1 Tax=Paracoccus sphaerophysae TaxID=690417 RepID=A0A099F9E5_9RHOB|nr:MATE family efflux transporter [Paracoccus sphaerophysae]KGJ07360.1 multidrug transporter MatE [Paracoccus sphaerophysae]
MSLKPHLSATLALGLPLVATHVARMMIGVIDTVMVGRYGVDPLAALVLATSYFFILMILGSGYALGLMGLIATARARRDEVQVRRSTRMAMWLSVIHAALVAPILWWSGQILIALGQEPAIAALAQEWLRVMLFAMPAVLCAMALNSFLAALGRPNAVLIVTLAGLPVNAALNWVLIWGNLGAPELGVTGAALASAAVNWLQLAALLLLAVSLPEARPYHLLQRLWRADWPAARQVFALGLPIGLTLVAESGMFTSTYIMMGWLGTVPLAAHGIALQIASLTFMVHLGISNAATIRVGTAHGNGDAAGLRRAALAAIILSVGFALLAMTAFLAIPRALTGLYLNAGDPQAPAIVALAAVLMVYAGLFQLVDAMQAIALGLLRGVHDTRVPMVLAVVSYWLFGLPAAWLLAFPLGFGPPGLWLGLLVGLSFAAALLMARFWGRSWQAAPLAPAAG